ncbi:SNF2 family N-terminal domain-domain-containing protein [Naematelia encephala]|uniref:Chromatin-remodeling ATPase INO80 n=1 Tax=Naematelia encephala TaxID=71784 RepID=A0A1Y2AZ72_9TREE|nr:SNF2 family N-terminal domain-domain-containing protein [Naematelia encephala]
MSHIPPASPSHFTRRSSASQSPTARMDSLVGASGGDRRSSGSTAPPSRMALSALVNSPPPVPTRTIRPSYHSPSPPSSAYSHTGYFPTASSSRIPQHTTEERYYPSYARAPMERTQSYQSDRSPHSYRSPSPRPQLPVSPTKVVNGNGHRRDPLSEPLSARALVPKHLLSAAEDVWEEPLRGYQKKREKEVEAMSAWYRDYYERSLLEPPIPIATTNGQARPSGEVDSKPELDADVDSATLSPRPPFTDPVAPDSSANGDPLKPLQKRKGWPADHPGRVAQREAKAAAIAAGLIPAKRVKKRPTKKDAGPSNATLEDELLGLAEGDVAVSSPMLPPTSDAPSMDDLGPDVDPLDPETIVQPSGLTRAEVIRKVEVNDMYGLTEDDVKAVQDEMWARKKDANGGAPIRKDGTVRKKPGPAKGWKKLRGIDERRSSAAEEGSEAGETSIAGDTINGEAEADIAALLGENGTPIATVKKPKAKRRKLDEGEEVTMSVDASEDEKPDLDDEILDAATASTSKKRTKGKEPGVGKGKWTRPNPLAKKAEELAVQQQVEGLEDGDDALLALAENGDSAAVLGPHLPNTEDPRGVSESEARVRAGLVEELQKQVWANIVRDVPRMYRVMQASDSTVKLDCSRTAAAAHRNAFAQRPLKPTYRSTTRMNKEAATRGKRVIREMLNYWKKNEKEELAARKRAEQEALAKAKADEEAREAKRQARKLNFLLTQTELYSHFIGKKIKTAEAEGNLADENVPKIAEHADAEIGVGQDGEILPDLDYDDDDESNLRRHAARGAQAAVQAAREKAAQFDAARQTPLDLDGDELNFQNPSLGENSVTITQPKMLMAQLKEYQLKGLTWLGNLYEQGINGILADEMGLGKTIQSISLLAYLAEEHNIWGPFLIITPMSTLHNWQQELARFVPRLKTIPYWGTIKDRETLRRIWCKRNLTITEDSNFHVVVTSYQIAVQDEKYFQQLRWQYMILDEAQAIKSSSSARWKSLLTLRCRNRLLLTGTPIQNSMHELWALLHFIMPSLFDSHEEFSEWFSKDIENAAGGVGGSLQPEQLRRLHMILKPFMLRRVKKHVQKELGDKIEIDLLVDLTARQKSIYKALRQRVSISDLMAQANNLNDTAGAKNLMNLVMQFRKVCSHPDLFQRADVVSPFMFGTFSQSGNLAREGDRLYCPDSATNAIEVKLPKLLWTDGGKLDRPSEESLAGSDTKVLGTLMNIWSSNWIDESLRKDGSSFSFLKVLDMSPGEAEKRAKAHPLVSLLIDSEDKARAAQDAEYESDPDFAASTKRRFAPIPPRLPRLGPDLESNKGGLVHETALRDITTRAWNSSYLSRRDARFAVRHAVAPVIRPQISSRSYCNTQNRLESDPLVQEAIYGLAPSERNDPQAVLRLSRLAPGIPPIGLLASGSPDQAPISPMSIPPTKRLIVDSAKLARLDDLLRELKDGGHRVLLYFQMTKMMNLVEEYLIYRQYKYLRLDGGSQLAERRDMVTSWQTNPDIFVFCLSTRAGGLGINLTAADTVIFYDHDWNPSNDAQAMDRAHRVGQTKQVTVYRLIARGTIEERIVKLARAKKDVQDVVVGGKALTDVAKPSEIVSLFMDDEELAESIEKRKQAEAHGYVAPAVTAPKQKSAFADGLGGGDDDEDDFFNVSKKATKDNQEDEEFADQEGAAKAAEGGEAKKKISNGKRKAPEGGEGSAKKPSKKKVKMALGPDGLPI